MRIGIRARARACVRARARARVCVCVCVEGSNHSLVLIIISEFTGFTERRRVNILSVVGPLLGFEVGS